MKKLLAISSLTMLLIGSFLFSALAGGAICLVSGHSELMAPITGSLFALSIILPQPSGGRLYVPWVAGICEKVQQNLNDILGSNAPMIKRTQIGYLQAIQSATNLQGVTKVATDPGNGKKKTVRITYNQRGTEADVKDTEITDCSTEVERAPFEEDVVVENYLRSPGLKFDENQMRLLCKPDSQYMQEVINGEIDALVRVLNKKLITKQNLNFGQFNPNLIPNYKDVVLLTGLKGSPNYKGESDIMEEFENIDSPGRPIVVGAGNLAHYTRQVGIGCCNQEGINLAQAGHMDFYRDRFVEGIVGANHFIGLVPGMVQLLTWNKYVGTYRKQNDVFSHTTILDPVTGLTFDMKWKYNDCNDTYSVHFGIWYELFFIPIDSYSVGDDLRGVNGSLNFRGLQEADYCC